ncbi:MAG: maltose alpha-D-glucosyltransferase [Candidatus Xenobia bacterium]
MTKQSLWYKDAIFYEVHVKSFKDSNADGIGDFEGLRQCLDYLQNLGVTCIWLLPMYPSPLRDDGYDVADYRDIHPNYGTLEDFRRFLNDAHDRGLRVITDLVCNHTSDQHPWFQEARRDPTSPRRDYYVWSDDPTRYSKARIIFTDTEVSNWTYDPVARSHYWHRFFSHQPDLNYENPAVHEELKNIMRFWLDMGIDGFRCDAVPYLYEQEGTNCENLPQTHEFFKQIRTWVDQEYPEAMLLAEANQWPTDVVEYFGRGHEFHMCYNFPIMPRLFMALRQENVSPIHDIMAQTPSIPENCQWTIFLRNHDELTLEMVTDEDRDYMYMEYARDPQMRINVGIRRRLAPLLNNSRRAMELLTSLLLSLPGSPILYYGDELGMGDNIYLGDRHGVRTPMQWTPDRNAGFSRADFARLYSPVIMDPVYGYQTVNVEAQSRTPTSFLEWVRRLIGVRKRYPAFGRGTFSFVGPPNEKILAYVREHEGQTLLCVFNLSRFFQWTRLDLSRWSGHTPVELIGNNAFPSITSDPYLLTMAPHAFIWFRLERQ